MGWSEICCVYTRRTTTVLRTGPGSVGGLNLHSVLLSRFHVGDGEHSAGFVRDGWSRCRRLGAGLVRHRWQTGRIPRGVLADNMLGEAMLVGEGALAFVALLRAVYRLTRRVQGVELQVGCQVSCIGEPLVARGTLEGLVVRCWQVIGLS